MSTPPLHFDHFEPAVRPQDDLFRHTNGRWLEHTDIPADQSRWGVFNELHEASQEACREIITGLTAAAPGSPEQLIADLYRSYLDEERVEQLGAQPLAEPLARVAAVADITGFAGLLGWMWRVGLGSLVGMDQEADPGDPTRCVAFFDADGLGLPDEAYYREDDKAEIREAYVAHMERLLALAGVPDAGAEARTVMALETEIAGHHWDLVTRRDLQKMYNPMSADELLASAPRLQLAEFLRAAGVPAERLATVVNCMPSFFTGVDGMLTDDRLPQWLSWARWHVVSGLAMLLSRPFVAERFGFLGTTLSGVPELEPRWKRGVAFVEARLGEAVGRLYVERHFSPQAKQRMDTLVSHLLEAYRQSISELDWMTAETKAEALAKLSKFDTKIGHPARWKDYSSMEIRPDDLVGNKLRAAAWHSDDTIAHMGEPVDRTEWLMPPQMVNAYYHPLRNEIVFPAAILQPPFFNEAADDAVNYGAIGAVIGHEIGHGFDDKGSTCDGDGKLRDWWTAADREAFEQRTKVLIAQYSALAPANTPDHHVNGELTIGENIGDLGGLGIAIKAWRLACGGTEPAPVDELTGSQRLFLSWASAWRSKSRPEKTIQILATDPHSPEEFRCNQIVRNLDDFYTAFDVQPTDAMWLPAEERVVIW